MGNHSLVKAAYQKPLCVGGEADEPGVVTVIK